MSTMLLLLLLLLLLLCDDEATTELLLLMLLLLSASFNYCRLGLHDVHSLFSQMCCALPHLFYSGQRKDRFGNSFK